jgi:hypothetical protein
MAEPQLTDIPTPEGTPMAMPTQLDDPNAPPTLLGAAWRQTMFGSVLGSDELWERSFPSDPTPVDTDQLIESLERDRVPEHLWDHFTSTKTVGQYNAIRKDLDEEQADQAVFAEAGLMKSLGAGFLVGLADPINWVPMGRAFNIARGTASVLSKTASIAAIGAATAAIQEPFLQGSQQLRTWQDGVMSIGASTLLAGFVGGVGATITSPGARAVATRLKGDVQDWLFDPQWNVRFVEHHRQAYQAIQDEIWAAPAGVPGGRARPPRGVDLDPVPDRFRVSNDNLVENQANWFVNGDKPIFLTFGGRDNLHLDMAADADHHLVQAVSRFDAVEATGPGYRLTIWHKPEAAEQAAELQRLMFDRARTRAGTSTTRTEAEIDSEIGRLLGYAPHKVQAFVLQTTPGERLPSVTQFERAERAFDSLQAAEDRLQLFRDNSMYRTGPMEWARTVVPRALGHFMPGFLDPSDYLLKRVASVEAKLGFQQMAEVVQLLNKNVHQHLPTAQGATTEVDWYMGRWAVWRDAMWGGNLREAVKSKGGFGDSFYAQAQRGGFAGNASDFDRAVHKAVSRGYTDPNPGIDAAAKLYKKNFVDPMRELMVQAGYPDPGDSPRFALGYAPRRYIPNAVRGSDGRGTEFRAVVGRAFFDERMGELRSEAARTGGTVSSQAEAGALRWANNKARDAYNNITGLNDIADGGINWKDVTPQNPFKERVVPLSDEDLLERGWIDARITDSAHTHLRQHVPNLLYATRFKTKSGKPDPSLEHSLIPKIEAEYKKLADTVGVGAQQDRIIAEGKNVIRVIRDQRDAFLRGPGFRDMEGNMARRMEAVMSNTMTFQAMRLLSNLVPASIPDLAATQFQHGFGTQLRSIAQATRKYFQQNPPDFGGMSRAEIANELKTFGAAIEWASNAGVAAHMDLNSPYQTSNGAFTRAMHSMNRFFSVTNGSQAWNDTAKGIAFRAAMDRILSAAERGWADIPDFDKRFLANHGIGQSELNRVAAAWRSQAAPLNDGFLRMGMMSTWDDKEAARLLSNAIAKNRASTVIQPRVGDKNYYATANPVWRMILQFQSFIFSHSLRVMTMAEQRLIADGLRGFMGGDSLRVSAGLIQYAAWGMAAHWLLQHAYDFAKGVPDGEKTRAEKLYDNPGQWVALGIERSGVTGMFGNYNMMGERMGMVGATRAAQAMAGDESLNVEQRGRWLESNRVRAVVGPTFAQAIDLSGPAIAAWNYPWRDETTFTRKDIKTLSEMGPFQNNIFFRKFVSEPFNRHMTEDVLGIAYDR